MAVARYDVVVVGAGPAGYVAAIRGAQRGGNICLVEKDTVGGTCLNWGCIPAKTLVATAGLLTRLRSADEFGIRIEGKVSLDYDKIVERKNRVVSGLVKGVEALLKSNGVTTLAGRATLLAKDRVRVEDASGQAQEVEAGSIIVATGSRPIDLPGLAIDGEGILNSDHAVSLRELPESILIVGAGAIGCEFGFIFNGFGSDVTIVEMLPHAVPLMDEGISELLEREIKKRKIKLHVNTKVAGVEKTASGMLEVALEDGKKVEVQKVLVSVGRAPNVEGFGLEDAGVELEANGTIRVNERMETSVPGVYAIGDVVGGSMLAHEASAEGIVAVENALGGNEVMDYNVVPSAIFTDPEIGSVGLTEHAARDRGYDVKIGRFPFRALGKAHALGEIAGEVKLVADAETDQIIGAHIIGPHATDLIHEMALAIKMEATAEEVAGTIHAHPTLSEALMEAGHALLGGAIHLPK